MKSFFLLTILMASFTTSFANLKLTYQPSENGLGNFWITNTGDIPVTIEQFKVTAQDTLTDNRVFWYIPSGTDNLVKKVVSALNAMMWYRTTLAPGQNVIVQFMCTKKISPEHVSVSVLQGNRMRTLCCGLSH